MIFLKTIFIRSKLRMCPVAGQGYNTLYNVSCDKSMRNKYAVGSIFVVDTLKDMGGFFTASGSMKVLLNTAELKDKAPGAAFAAYSALVGKRFSYVSENDESAVAAVSKGKTYLERIKKRYPPPTIEDTGFSVDPDIWYKIVRNTKQQINTMLLGPTGLGKTSIIKLLGQKMGIDVRYHDMGAMLDPVSGLLGTHRLNKDGSYFDFANFTKDITEGCIVVLDELSRAPATANNILFPTLDFRRHLPVAVAGEGDRLIRMHEKCCMMATANQGGQYTGTMPLDAALKSRFFLIELDYLKGPEEVCVLMKRSEISIREAEKIVAVANSVRDLCKKGELSEAPGTRETLMVAEMVRDGFTTIEALESVFMPLFEGTRSEGERGVVIKIIASK